MKMRRDVHLSGNSLVLGTVQFGLPYGIANKTGQPDQALAVEIINQAWESGIREFDTAQGYGVSEEVLGKALHEIGVTGEARVLSKFDPELDHLNLDCMVKSLDRSLEKLGVERLLGILLHREDLLDIWNSGLSEVLYNLVDYGKVEHIGVSVYSPDRAVQALNSKGIDIVQIPTNILDRRFEKAGVFRLAKKNKKRVYVRSIFLQGLILMKLEEIPKKMDFAIPVLKKIEILSRDFNLSRQAVAIGYLKSEMPDAMIIFGAETPKQVEDNYLCWKSCIPSALVFKVKKLFDHVDERILNPGKWVN